MNLFGHDTLFEPQSHRFPVELSPRDMRWVFDRFIGIIGAAEFEKRVLAALQISKRHRAWLDYLGNRNPLLIGMVNLAGRIYIDNEDIREFASSEENTAAAFLVGTTKVYRRLSSGGRRRMSGRIRDALKNADALGALSLEIETIVHLRRKEFEVLFSYFELGGGYDFLARKNGLEIEVECKFLSHDAGRKVHQKYNYALLEVAEPMLRKLLPNHQGGHFLEIRCKKRFEPNSQEILDLTNAMQRVILERSPIETAHATLRHQSFALTEVPRLSNQRRPENEEIEAFISDKFGHENKEMFYCGDASTWAAIIVLVSDEADHVLTSLIETLKKSAKEQFSGRRPAVFAVKLAGISSDGIQKFEGGTQTKGIDYAISHLFSERPQIHTVSLTSNLFLRELARQTKSAFVYRNHTHPHFSDPRADLFLE